MFCLPEALIRKCLVYHQTFSCLYGYYFLQAWLENLSLRDLDLGIFSGVGSELLISFIYHFFYCNIRGRWTSKLLWLCLGIVFGSYLHQCFAECKEPYLLLAWYPFTLPISWGIRSILAAALALFCPLNLVCDPHSLVDLNHTNFSKILAHIDLHLFRSSRRFILEKIDVNRWCWLFISFSNKIILSLLLTGFRQALTSLAIRLGMSLCSSQTGRFTEAILTEYEIN